MNEEILKHMELKTTEELFAILQQNDRNKYLDETFNIIRYVLEKRGIGNLTDKSKDQENQENEEKSRYCTNCGNEVLESTIACTKCGLPPRTENKYCYNCGVEVTEKQVMCIKCGVSLNDSPISSSKSSADSSKGIDYEKQAGAGWLVAGYIFALLGGWFGLAIGIYLSAAKVKLPDGTKVKKFNEASRKNGYIIMVISVVAAIIWLTL